MLSLATTVESAALGYLTAPVGSTFQLNAIAQSIGTVPVILVQSVVISAASAEIMEQRLVLAYPVFALQCEKLSNTLKEKFRVFSGTAQLSVDVRYSQDQIGGIAAVLQNYVSAACQIFDGARGAWGNGLFYRGGYEVAFSAIKKGGKGFLQSADISLSIDISI